MDRIKELEIELKRMQLNNYILEEENSLLRENVEAVLNDLERMRGERVELDKELEEINKVKSGKIYKVLVKAKKIIKK